MSDEDLSSQLLRIIFQLNMSNDLLKLDKCTLITEDNAYGDSAAPVIEITFGNDYIHILHDLSK